MFDWTAMPQMPMMPQMPFGPYATDGDASMGASTTETNGASCGQAGSFPNPFQAAQGTVPLGGMMQMLLYPQMQMMMFAQQMVGMQMQVMQQLMEQMQQGIAQGQAGAQQAQPQAGPGMQLPFNLSVADLQKLLQLDASPKTLSLLQKALDFVFDAYTKEG